MDRQKLLESILKSQSAVLSTSSSIRTVISDTAGVLINEESDPSRKHRGSVKGRLPNLPRNFEEGYQRLFQDYFSNSPVYTNYLFCQRFRMHQSLFLQIVDDVTNHNSYFVQKKDALGRPGLRPIQKICLAVHMLAYGGAANANDKYLRLSESTSLEALSQF
jgi:hypothetical protein